MIVNLPNGLSIKWNGSHTANVYSPEGIEVDCFSFSYDKNHVSQLDFTTALESYVSYISSAEELDDEEDDWDDEEDDWDMTDAEADAHTFASVGWGTDEDYGLF